MIRMHNRPILILLSSVAATGFAMTGCMAVQPADPVVQESRPGGNTDAAVDSTGFNTETSPKENSMPENGYSYTTKEIRCQNGKNSIYGIAYIPDTGSRKLPLVIFSHELGCSHTNGIPYAERLAENGYAAYIFDFCGGSVGRENKSDGKNTEMSVMTEVSDIEAVIEAAAAWDFVDPDRIVLLGASQGGTATALAACRNEDKVAGMIMMYPALCLFSDVHAMFGDSIENVPDEFYMLGGYIRVGKNYATDAWDVDVYDELSRYGKKVLLLHGDRDNVVNISYSDRAATVIPDCEYTVIEGAGHGFANASFEEAMALILRYLDDVIQ